MAGSPEPAIQGSAVDLDSLIARPDAPICSGCFRRQLGTLVGCFCRGADGTLRGFAERHGFDVATTPWAEVGDQTRDAFLFGERGRGASWVGISNRAQVDSRPARRPAEQDRRFTSAITASAQS